MIHVRVPLRISFVGGGTDLPAFYRKHPGTVISATINKFVHVVINTTPLIQRVVVKYQKFESVATPEELEHPSVRAALVELNVRNSGLEIASFADLPSKTGLGSSSSFAVALTKGLCRHLGRRISAREAAELACRIEIDILKEPVGKQDQYAAAFGGFNVFRFNPDETVDVKPVLMGFKERMLLEDHSLLFFTGITGDARSVLSGQSQGVDQKFEMYKKMTASVPMFEASLRAGDMEQLGAILHDGWNMKKTLASGISNPLIDKLYGAGKNFGAFGGKLLGAGGRGCVYFIAPPKAHEAIRGAIQQVARSHGLAEFTEIPFEFVQSGADVVLDRAYHRNLN